MDFLDILSGRNILEFLGASVRFVFFNLSTLSNDNDFRTFSSFRSPNGSAQKRDDNSDRNHMIGGIFLGAFVFLLVFFNT